MAKQLNLLSQGRVITTALHSEMERSYLEYAMSVIVGRALPDVRDGLKPVHRRILYAMHELGLTPDRPYRKCARVVGDVLGKYHPHGDQAVYDALVRMVQNFSSRYPLLDGHGNFGSVDNDPPAAMRYTETRLAPVAQEVVLNEIGEATVDFTGNFDNSQQEPTVLPAQLPILLLNGSSGIAVGMATNIPPHNLGEIVEALIALIDRPDLSQEQLLALVPGPDFPTGGEIIGTEGIREAYTTGRGSITLRGTVQEEEIQPGRGRHRRTALIVTELPYQVNKAAWIEKIADLINQGRIEGIADLRDESDRDGMRVVIELKREAQSQVVLEQLYRLTPLQINFGVILLALHQGQPQQLPLQHLLQHFLDFREQTLTRRYRHQLEQSQQRLHLVEGLLAALTNVDRVIQILREAADGSTAKLALQRTFDLSDRQSDAILAMPLRRLTGLEQQNLQREFSDLTRQISDLERLLGDRRELQKALKKELRALKRKHGDPRRTRFSQQAATVELPEPTVVDEEVVLELTQRGYVRCSRPSSRSRRSNGAAAAAVQETQKDLPILSQTVRRTADLLVFTRSGKGYSIKLSDIPFTSSRERGTPLITLLPESAQTEAIVAHFICSEYPAQVHLVFLTQQGRIKRLPLSEFADLTGRGLTALKLKEEDQLLAVSRGATETEVVLATSSGRLLHFPWAEVPETGRNTVGPQAMRLRKQESLVGLVPVQPDAAVVLITRQGYGKRLLMGNIRRGHRGDLGTQVFQFALKADALAALLPALPQAEVVCLTDAQRVMTLNLEQIPRWGKDGPGDALLKLERGESVVMAIALSSDAHE